MLSIARQSRRGYDSHPRYPAVGGGVGQGWDAAAADLSPGSVLAVDGPVIAGWARVRAGIAAALASRGLGVAWLDTLDAFAPWPVIVEKTSTTALYDDPDFEMLADVKFEELLATVPTLPAPEDGVLVVHGPGAALFDHDVLWYIDLPKRYAEAAVTAGEGRNLGQRDADAAPSTKRLFYVDWPLLDRHREHILPSVDRWVDVQRDRPNSVTSDVLRATATWLAERPFRTRPTFNTTSWGGHWAQQTLGMNQEAFNTALGYELIAPESGVLVGGADADVEVPFQVLVAMRPREILGEVVHETFGTSFPVRFDYLDTFGGGNLSVHVHPQDDYMRTVFGWPYTQHETYYVLVAGDDSQVMLGLRDDVDLCEFRRRADAAAQHGEPFEILDFVQAFPAHRHQLFTIPAGTPHSSGVGNVVLEVSATPYLYSLRFYDWLRRDDNGRQRPVHVGHAFTNLNTMRTGRAVADELIQAARPLRAGAGWVEELLGERPEMFFEVRRLTGDPSTDIPENTEGRFHVLNVVDGDGVTIISGHGEHYLAYAETLIVPAAVGAYVVRVEGGAAARVVKAVVR